MLNLTLKEIKSTYGKYGQMRLQFLKEHKSGLFNSMILKGTLTEHLNDIDELAREYVNQFIEQKSAEQSNDENLMKTGKDAQIVRPYRGGGPSDKVGWWWGLQSFAQT